MSNDKELEQEIQQYQDLAKQNKEVDVANLMMSALQKRTDDKVPSKTRKWLYVFSLALPPLGLIPAVKYYFFDDHSDHEEVATICILMTVIAILAALIFFKSLFSSAGVSPQQIEQIKPSDIMQLTQ